MVATTNVLETTIGELVTERPARARLFESLGIDYCCGGKKRLAQVIVEHRLQESAILKLLAAFDAESTKASEPDVAGFTLAELADHIEQTHHAYLKTELPRLEFLVNKVANRHGPDRPQLVELATDVRRLQGGVGIAHAEGGDDPLPYLPPVRKLDRSAAVPLRLCAESDSRDDAGARRRRRCAERMRELTDNYTVPPEACNTYRGALRQSSAARIRHAPPCPQGEQHPLPPARRSGGGRGGVTFQRIRLSSRACAICSR